MSPLSAREIDPSPEDSQQDVVRASMEAMDVV